MGAIGRTFVLSVCLLAGFDLPATATANCPCPKSKMIELYGTVSMFPPPLPGPRRSQPTHVSNTPIAPATALPSMAEMAKTMPTCSIDPLGLERLGDPLIWNPIFVK